MVGVGGQGVIMASDVLAGVALSAGYDVKKTDTLGMAQRGGSVISHVRIAKKVRSPLIREGDVDILFAFEKLEAARWGYFLRVDGRALVNNHVVPPLAVSLGTQHYPAAFQGLSYYRRNDCTGRLSRTESIERPYCCNRQIKCQIKTLSNLICPYLSRRIR